MDVKSDAHRRRLAASWVENTPIVIDRTVEVAMAEIS